MLGKLILDGNGQVPLDDVGSFLKAITGAYVKLSILEVMMTHGRRGLYREEFALKFERNYANIFESLEKSISRISDDSILDPEIGYAFPSVDYIMLQKEQLGLYFSDSFINESPHAIDSLIKRIRNSFSSGRRENYIVTGKIGSGKTTFINYLNKKLIHLSAENNILPVKISAKEFSDLIHLRDLGLRDYEKKFTEALVNSTIRRALEYFSSQDDLSSLTAYLKDQESQLSLVTNNAPSQIEGFIKYIESGARVDKIPINIISKLVLCHLCFYELNSG